MSRGRGNAYDFVVDGYAANAGTFTLDVFCGPTLRPRAPPQLAPSGGNTALVLHQQQL